MVKHINKVIKIPLLSDYYNYYSQQKADLLSPFFTDSEKVLDFGCGNLQFASRLKKKHPFLSITGVDVVDFSDRIGSIPFIKYNGTRLPFPDRSFDTIIAVNVLHHCVLLQECINECKRVAKKRIIIFEPVYTYAAEIPLMKLMDMLYNLWKVHEISFPFKFHSVNWWEKALNDRKWKISKSRNFGNSLSIIPVGKEQCFEVIRTK